MYRSNIQNLISFLSVSIGTMIIITFSFTLLINYFEKYMDFCYLLLFLLIFRFSCFLFEIFIDTIKIGTRKILCFSYIIYGVDL